MGGGGNAIAHATVGKITISFQLQKQKVDGELIPGFGLSFCDVILDAFVVEVTQSYLSWILNALAKRFQEQVQEYVTVNLQEALSNNITCLVEPLNSYIRPYWPFLLNTVGMSIAELPAAMDVWLQVTVVEARNLRKLHQTGINAYVNITVLDRHGRGTPRNRSTKLIPNVIDPNWEEVHQLRWKKGESLRFTLLDKGMIHSRKQGMKVVHWKQFYPQEFESVLVVNEAGGQPITLYVKIAPIRVEDHIIQVDQQPGQRLGIRADMKSMIVDNVDPEGTVWSKNMEQQDCDEKRIRAGDVIVAVNKASESTDAIVGELDKGCIQKLTYRRIFGLREGDPPPSILPSDYTPD